MVLIFSAKLSCPWHNYQGGQKVGDGTPDYHTTCSCKICMSHMHSIYVASSLKSFGYRSDVAIADFQRNEMGQSAELTSLVSFSFS